MKLLENQRCLITNNHVISQDNIYNDVEIEIYNQKKMKLNLKNRKIKYFPKPKDITVIEIKPSDKILRVQFLRFNIENNICLGNIFFRWKYISIICSYE